MRRITFTRPHDLAALHDELLEAGAIGLDTLLEGEGDTPNEIALLVPDDADVGAIRAAAETVINAHDAERGRELRKKIEEIRARAEEERRRPYVEAAEAHIAAVKALPDVASVRAYTPDTGWPTPGGP